jgi:peptidoglycan/LPS O-acetylase OafA/YrhL
MDRRPDIDWLRVIAFGGLVLYHSSMAWSGWEWHINAPESLPWLAPPMHFVSRWRIPLIYMISGAAIMLALGHRTAGAFAMDRVRRLLIPLVFGILFICPPQQYIELVHLGQFKGSFIEWLPQAWSGVHPWGNLTWNHLWFVGYVLILTFVLLPVFLWMRTPGGKQAQDTTARLLGPVGHWVSIVPVIASITWLSPISQMRGMFYGDPHGVFMAALLMLYGAFVFCTPAMLARLNRQRWFSLAVGIGAYTALVLVVYDAPPDTHVRVLGLPVSAPLTGLNLMAWLFAVIGFGNRHLTARPKFLNAATEMVYPFYILHQTVTVIAVYYLLAWKVPALPAFLTTVFVTFVGTWLLCVFAVQPWPWVRPLFGMKPLEARRPALPASRTAL